MNKNLMIAAGAVSFLLALLIAGDSLLDMREHNTVGSPVSLGFASAFLSFAAAAWGISRKTGE